jgi:hypothetical protein
MTNRTVFFVSDGTGITAETFGNAILAQFEMEPRHVRLPFIDTMDKAHAIVRQINHTYEVEGKRPIVFTTLVNDEILWLIKAECKGQVLDMTDRKSNRARTIIPLVLPDRPSGWACLSACSGPVARVSSARTVLGSDGRSPAPQRLTNRCCHHYQLTR